MGLPPGLTVDVYRSIVEAMTEHALCFIDANGIIQTWNTGGERVHGYGAAEIIGQHVGALYNGKDRQAGVAEAVIKTAAETGKAEDHRWMPRKNGTEFWAEGVVTALRDDSGTLIGYVRVTRDAAEQLKLQQALERSTDELQRFAFTVSHDLQEPLRNVRNYAELIERRYKGRLDEDANEFIRYIVDGVSRMGQLLKDILAYSQAGRDDRTRPEPTQAADVLQWALMNVDGIVKETGAVITYDALPAVHADQTQLANVLQHLIGNSIKFRSKEVPRIHISARPEGNLWEFSIKDNGIGVDPEQTERIFGVFKRLHGREVPGTGIGLAICRKIVEAHGGRIWMESQPGQGSTIRFTLPAT
jgi:PAS domain S-box-containing protein